MKAVFLRGVALLLTVSLGACATTETFDTNVTRFHLNQPIARGEIAVQPIDLADANSLEFRTYADAVARELTRLGWTVVPAATRTEQVALVNVEQGSRFAGPRSSPVRIGIGGATGDWDSSVGGGVSFGVGGKGGSEVIGTRLEVRIMRPSDTTVFWEGRAQTEARAGTPDADRRIAVERLAEALFLDFPGESGRTIRLR